LFVIATRPELAEGRLSRHPSLARYRTDKSNFITVLVETYRSLSSRLRPSLFATAITAIGFLRDFRQLLYVPVHLVGIGIASQRPRGIGASIRSLGSRSLDFVRVRVARGDVVALQLALLERLGAARPRLRRGEHARGCAA
jgi:hypothetical protein